MEELLTPKDISERLHICLSAVSNLTKIDKTGKAKLPHIRIGRAVRVRKEDLEAYILKNSVGSYS